MTVDLTALGWDEAFSLGYAPLDRSDAAPARVLRTELGVCTVLGVDGVTRASLGGSALLAAARDPAARPCPGDWVVVRRWPDRRHTVEAVLPRRSVLTAPAGRTVTGAGSLAANVDSVVSVGAHAGADLDELRELVSPGRTLALVGGTADQRSALVGALTGVTALPPRTNSPTAVHRQVRRPACRSVLVPVPGGGAVVDVAGTGSGRMPRCAQSTRSSL
ncbi:MAG TPA: hypothetical protein VFO77_02325 [Actinoplanes sp.]|nr:hypothetical protein [Actinoplanes sp.]